MQLEISLDALTREAFVHVTSPIYDGIYNRLSVVED